MEYTENELNQIMEAIWFGESITLKYLLREGLNLNVVWNRFGGFTPLQFAARAPEPTSRIGIHDEDVLLMLLSLGADPNFNPDPHFEVFNTPLEHYCLPQERLFVLKNFDLLLEANAEITSVVEDWLTDRLVCNSQKKEILERHKHIRAVGPPPEFIAQREEKYKKMREWISTDQPPREFMQAYQNLCNMILPIKKKD